MIDNAAVAGAHAEFNPVGSAPCAVGEVASFALDHPHLAVAIGAQAASDVEAILLGIENRRRRRRPVSRRRLKSRRRRGWWRLISRRRGWRRLDPRWRRGRRRWHRLTIRIRWLIFPAACNTTPVDGVELTIARHGHRLARKPDEGSDGQSSSEKSLVHMHPQKWFMNKTLDTNCGPV